MLGFNTFQINKCMLQLRFVSQSMKSIVNKNYEPLFDHQINLQNDVKANKTWLYVWQVGYCFGNVLSPINKGSHIYFICNVYTLMQNVRISHKSVCYVIRCVRYSAIQNEAALQLDISTRQLRETGICTITTYQSTESPTCESRRSANECRVQSPNKSKQHLTIWNVQCLNL